MVIIGTVLPERFTFYLRRLTNQPYGAIFEQGLESSTPTS